MSRPPQLVAAKTAKWWKCCSASLGIAFHQRFGRPMTTKWREGCFPPRPAGPTLRKRSSLFSAAFRSSLSQQSFSAVFPSSPSQHFSAAFLGHLAWAMNTFPERTLHSSAFLPWPQPLPKACQHFPGQTMLIGKRGWKYARRGNTQGAAIAPFWKIGEAKLMWT